MFPKEWAQKCHQLINDAHHWIKQILEKHYPSPCIFGDLEGIVLKGSYNPGDDFMTKFHSIDAARVCKKQYCHAHSGDCPLISQDSHLEVAGLPCWDFSIAGKRRMEEGPTNTAFITHAKRMVEKEVPLVLIENTKDCYGLFLFWLWMDSNWVYLQSVSAYFNKSAKLSNLVNLVSKKN